MSSGIAPVQAQQRIHDIDVLRGFAVLGILAMNIIGFAFHPATYGDPTVQGGAQGGNLWTFITCAILFDGKMRGLFTLLFGAGICLLTGRAAERGAAADSADIYYRRLLWLLLFGAAHAYLLWWGEVLYPYAVLGLLLYPFRKMTPQGLWITASLLCALMIGGTAYEAWDTGEALKKYGAAQVLKKAGKKLTETQEGDISKWEEKLKGMKPDAAAIKKNREQNTGGFVSAVKVRAELTGFFHRLPLYSPMLWDFLVMMLAGMALLKAGVLTGERSTGFYVKMAAAGFLIGLPLHALQLAIQMRGWFSIVSNAWAFAAYEPARIALTFAYVATGILLLRRGVWTWLSRALAATGQMALTNYVAQSVICTLIFNVLAWHGRLERHQVYAVVAAIWALELAWSAVWLSRYRFGPLEWGWRSLTYWERQPFRFEADEREDRPVPPEAPPEPVQA